MTTQAVILAAGRGTRLAPITDTIPKAMIEIGRKPILQIILEQLKSVGVSSVVIVVHHLKEKIIDYFGNEFKNINITYAEQKEMIGNADAMLYAEKHITDDKFFYIAVDSLFETALLKRLLSHKSDGVLTCKKVEDPRRFGVLEIEGKRVTKIIEKPEHPPTKLAYFSVCLLPKDIFDACRGLPLRAKGEYWITDAIQKLIDSGMRIEYEMTEQMLDIGTVEQYNEAQELIKKIKV